MAWDVSGTRLAICGALAPLANGSKANARRSLRNRAGQREPAGRRRPIAWQALFDLSKECRCSEVDDPYLEYAPEQFYIKMVLINFSSGQRPSRIDLVDVSLFDGGISPILAHGRFPDWAPSGTHYIYTTNTLIEDRSAKGEFARVLLSLGSEGIPHSAVALGEPHWVPDGQRFAFGIAFGNNPDGRQIWVSKVAGARPFPIDPAADASTMPCWSPDGEWIAYVRTSSRKRQLAKVRSSAGANPIVLQDAVSVSISPTYWSPTGHWILYQTAAGLSIASPDGKSSRSVTSRAFMTYGLSKSGDDVIGIVRNTASEGFEWELISVDVKTGVEKRLAALDLPPEVTAVEGFSLHPDGKRFATSIWHSPSEIWMLEGFDQQKSWLDRLLRR